MGLRIHGCGSSNNNDEDGVFVIRLNEISNDESTAEGLRYELYIELLEQYGAKKHRSDAQYWFGNIATAERFLSSPELEPYLILYEIVEG